MQTAAAKRDKLSIASSELSPISANLQRATRLRQSTLQKAFTGKLC